MPNLRRPLTRGAIYRASLRVIPIASTARGRELVTMRSVRKSSRISSKQSTLDLARALKRYTRMRPENAYVALAKAWPQPVVALVSDVLWSEVKGRTVKEITREIMALMRKARAAHRAVRRAKRRAGGTVSAAKGS